MASDQLLPLARLPFPLVAFSLFAIFSVLLCLLLALPLLRVVWLSGGWVWPQGDDDAGHVVTACPVARCVGSQTVLQQLPEDMQGFRFQKKYTYSREAHGTRVNYG